VKAVWETSSESETRDLGEMLASRLRPDGVLLLRGALGVGKTILTQGIARGLGIDPQQVQSPSFTLVREHSGTGTSLIHIDLYRLDPAEVEGIGIWEILETPAVKVVEWSERLPLNIERALEVEIRVGNIETDRVLTLIDRSRESVVDKQAMKSARGNAKGDKE
jgi:tRNA threonylcarbamoyladenosine biosynthesis protein TsaE